MFENSNVTMFNRNGKLYVQFYVDGKLKQRSTRLKDTPKNRKIVQKEVIPQLIMKLKSGELSKQKPKEFNFYADIYLKQKEGLKTYNEIYNIVSNQLYPFFGRNTSINKITRGLIKEFVDKKLLEATPQRVKKILGILSAIIDIAIDYEHIEDNPAKKIKLPKNKIVRNMQPFTPEEVNLLLNNADRWFKNLLAFLFYTGVRTGEMLAVTWSDVDLDNLTIRINKAKRHGVLSTPKTPNAIRTIPIFEPLIPYLKDQKKLAKEAKTLNVFFSPSTKREFFGSKHLTPHWKRLLNKCKMEYRVLYNTRHTFAINMIKAGVNISDVSQILGHKNMRETLEHYAKFLPEAHLKIKRNIDPFNNNINEKLITYKS